MSTLSELVRERSGVNAYKRQPIIEFIQGSQGLAQTLFPAQKPLIKLIHNAELDDRMPTNPVEQIRLWHPISEEYDYRVTEKDYVDILYEQGRLNIEPDRIKDAEILYYLMVIGRRGTKSVLVSQLISYELDDLIRIPHPQKYFGLALEDRIGITYVALGGDNAEKLFSKSAKMIASVKGLQRHIPTPPTLKKLKLYTANDLDNPRADEQGYITHSIELTAHANSPGIRGDNNFRFVCEEFAHFNQAAKSTKDEPLDTSIWDAISPSISSFRHPSLARMAELHAEDPRYPAPDPMIADKPYGKGYILSSPLNNKGKYYELCSTAMEQGADSNSLLINLPTWEINPRVSKVYYKSKWMDSPASFEREYEAKFVKGGDRWIKSLFRLYRSFDTRLDPDTIVGDPSYLYFGGLDFALANDGVALAISHIEPKHSDGLDVFGKCITHHPEAKRHPIPEEMIGRKITDEREEEALIELDPHDDIPLNRQLEAARAMHTFETTKERYVVDFVGSIYPERGQILQMDDVALWLSGIWGRFRMFAGIFDQWSGDLIEQTLHKNRHLGNIRKVSFGEKLNSDVAKNFMATMYSDSLRMPNVPDLDSELLKLTVSVQKKYTIKIEVPANEGHDDVYDSISRSLFLANAFHTKNKALLEAMLGEEFSNSLVDRAVLRIGSDKMIGGRPLNAAVLKQRIHGSLTGNRSIFAGRR